MLECSPVSVDNYLSMTLAVEMGTSIASFTVCLSLLFHVPDADEEAFEDNAEEYIRRDIEGSGEMPMQVESIEHHC